MTLYIKPLSVNQAWQGKRYKTNAYKAYETAVTLMLPKLKINPENKLRINFEFGFSNKASDIDNPCKPMLDIMQKKWKFDDKMVYEMNLVKDIVPKGKEYIKIQVTEIL